MKTWLVFGSSWILLLAFLLFDSLESIDRLLDLDEFVSVTLDFPFWSTDFICAKPFVEEAVDEEADDVDALFLFFSDF